MADGLNRVTLMGNLGADPELRFTQGGHAVLHCRLATTMSYLDRDRDKVRQERTDWHNVVVWGKRGEALGKILGKGSQVYVEGPLRTSSYDNKEGVKVYRTEVIAQHVIIGGRGQGGGSRGVEDDAEDYSGEGRDPRTSRPGRPAPPPAASPPGGDDDYPPPGGDDDISF